jgi:hypothetical protein
MMDLSQILAYGDFFGLSLVSYFHRKIHRFGCYFRRIDHGVGLHNHHPVVAVAAGDIDSLSR